MSINVTPWVLACGAAIWFGLLAVKAGKSWVLWALAGGLFGLVSSTCVLGLGQATGIPFSDSERTALEIRWTLAAVAIVAVVGGLFTWSLWHVSRPATPARTQPQPVPVAGKKTDKSAA